MARRTVQLRWSPNPVQLRRHPHLRQARPDSSPLRLQTQIHHPRGTGHPVRLPGQTEPQVLQRGRAGQGSVGHQPASGLQLEPALQRHRRHHLSHTGCVHRLREARLSLGREFGRCGADGGDRGLRLRHGGAGFLRPAGGSHAYSVAAALHVKGSFVSYRFVREKLLCWIRQW